MGQPYCRNTRELLFSSAKSLGAEVIDQATVAVIQGPRFSTVAESRWLSNNGWDIVNMTQYPECYFAKELGLCYGAIAAVTDYDVGLGNDLTISHNHMEKVLEVFRINVEATRKILLSFVDSASKQSRCGCAQLIIKTYYEQV
jgi:5'-methylthioadenosine phosphorylase